MEREKLASRLGFILLSAGCAIGIGNVWKFPYMTGKNGGAAFVLFYLIFLIAFGVPIMTMEFALGRAAKKSPVLLYQQLEKKGQKWHIHGYVSMAGNYLLMMFYTVVSGWMVYYLYAALTNKYGNLDSDGVTNFFTNMISSPSINMLCMVFVVVAGFFIISMGLQNGLEKVSKYMMLFLLLLMVALAVNSLMLDGGREGVIFYLKPDFSKMVENGVGTVILNAMMQAFFTLSLGIGSMAIFGSYIDKDHALMGEAINVAMLDTFVAICSGLIIFPACYAFNVAVDSGPGLLFITLPNVFNSLTGGRFWGSLFFLFMFFAAFSTVLAVFETIVSCCMDLFNISRKKACYINMVVIILLAIPCALGFNLWSNIQPLGAGTNILDLEDYIVSNWILPLGSMVFLLFCTTRYGWGWDNFIKEANTGQGIKMPYWTKYYMTYVLPFIVLIVFVFGLIK